MAGWTRGDACLSFEISDVKLFVKTFKGAKSSSHFLNLKIDDLLKDSYKFLATQQVQAVELGSCPVGKEGIKRIQFLDGAVVYCMSTYQHYYVNTSSGFSQYLEKFKSKTRSTLKKKVHKLLSSEEATSGGGTFVKFSSVSEMQTFVEHASIVSAKTYQARLFNRGIPTDGGFLLRVLKLAEHGLVRGYILYCAGRPVAYTYVPLISEGVVLYDYNGYDPDFSKLSPGTVMQYKIIEDLCADPNITIYDLCVGDDEHKALFATDFMDCADVIVLRSSLRNTLLVLAHLGLTSASSWTGTVLKCVNLKRLVKRFIRRHATVPETPAAV